MESSVVSRSQQSLAHAVKGRAVLSAATAIAAFLVQAGIEHESVIGWCVSIDRDEDGFLRLPGEAKSH